MDGITLLISTKGGFISREVSMLLAYYSYQQLFPMQRLQEAYQESDKPWDSRLPKHDHAHLKPKHYVK